MEKKACLFLLLVLLTQDLFASTTAETGPTTCVGLFSDIAYEFLGTLSLEEAAPLFPSNGTDSAIYPFDLATAGIRLLLQSQNRTDFLRNIRVLIKNTELRSAKPKPKYVYYNLFLGRAQRLSWQIDLFPEDVVRIRSAIGLIITGLDGEENLKKLLSSYAEGKWGKN